jgi:hypothetical protein
MRPKKIAQRERIAANLTHRIVRVKSDDQDVCDQHCGPTSDHPWLSGSAVESRQPVIWVIRAVSGEWIRIVRINWQSDGKAENSSVIFQWES